MKKHRALSMMLSAAMLYTAAPATVLAAGTSGENLAADASVRANTEAAKFTHKEWTGNDYTDLGGRNVDAEDVFGIAREAASAQIIPYHSEKAAADAVWDYNARENSQKLQMLTGESQDWELTVVANQTEAEKMMTEGHAFYQSSFSKGQDEDWKTVQLPRSWTTQGFDFSIYTNTQMPWQSKYDTGVSAPNAPVNYNPVGLYRKTFRLDPTLKGSDRRIYIDFRGVESAYYVYVNGHEVGYSEDSFSPHKFDITDYLNQDGDNLLAVKVHKFCDGTWFEDQDMIYDGGIFRDVYLTSAPLVQIRDYHYTTDLDADYKNAVLNIEADIRNLSSSDHTGWTLEAKAFDRSGNQILQGACAAVDELSAAGSKTVQIVSSVTNPALWSAENPNLYALVLTLKDGQGNEIETVSTQLGFREIGFTRTEVDANYNVTTTKWDPVTINGMPLLLKGADRHDTDPFYGKAVPQKTIAEDLKIMKQYNLNAVRTSHYSNDDYLYWLANDWGLYLMGETNMESHALMNKSYEQGLFYELGLDRTEYALKRLRNNPSIVMWSIGNEMAYTGDKNFANGLQRDMIWHFKNIDRTRPVHSEGQDASLGTDMRSNMYPDTGTVWSRGGEGKMPYVLCEYAHAMGNSVGNLKEYWDAIRAQNNQLGAFIWDWVDQARAVELSSLGASYPLTDKKGNEGTAYGSSEDWKSNAGAKSLNGGKSFAGYAAFPSSTRFNDALAGSNKSFTFEAIVKPASNANNSVLISKGDHQAALKTGSSGSNTLEFFVYNNNNWSSVSCSLPSDWAGKWHQVAGVYDKNTAKIYIDGVEMASGSVRSDIYASSDPIGIGYDAYEGRTFDGEISIGRIYTRALSQAELAAQNSENPGIPASSDDVLVWADYADEHGEAQLSGWDYYASKDAQTNLYKEEAKGKFYGYGGDWGDKPNDNSFCENGLISADRMVQPELYEVKEQYQNFWISAQVEDLDAGSVKVYNESSFENLNDYNVRWEVLENGIVVRSGKVTDTDVAPRQTKKISVPFEVPVFKPGADYYLNIVVETKEDQGWAQAGHEVTRAQMSIPSSAGQAARTMTDKKAEAVQKENSWSVSGDDFSFEIFESDGLIHNYVFKGEKMLETGPKISLWRGLMENDKGSGYDSGWNGMDDSVTIASIANTQNEAGEPVITVSASLENGAAVTTVYTISANGAVNVDMTMDGTSTGYGNYIRVGSTMAAAEGYEDVTWYGNGPVESLFDRKTFAKQGIYSSTASALFYPYLKVDDTGTLTDTKWMALGAQDKNTMLIAASTPLEMSALHFTEDDLNSTAHVYGLNPRKETIIGVNYRSMGTGGATCGPAALSQYQIPNNQAYSWNFTIVPMDGAGQTAQTLTDTAAAYRTVEVFNRNEYDQQRAQEVLEKVKALYPYSYSQLDEAQKLAQEVVGLTEEQKALIKDEKLDELMAGKLETIESLENKKAILKDQSNNALEIELGDAELSNVNGTTIMTGAVTIGHNEIFDELIEGGGSWTIETEVTPTGLLGYNMFVGKGDETFGIRVRSNTNWDFHIKEQGGSWKSIEYSIPEAERANVLNQKHKITAVYDADNSKLYEYVDGVKVDEVTLTAGAKINASGYPLTWGACPSTGRTSAAQFESLKVFKGVKTPQDIEDAQPTDSDTALWLLASNVEQMDIAPITEAKIESESDSLKAGTTLSLTLSGTPAETEIKSAVWSASDQDGQPVSGVSISGDGTRAVLTVARTVPAGTKLVVKADAINGSAVFAIKTITVEAADVLPVVEDLSGNGHTTELPETASLKQSGDEQAMEGFMQVKDDEKTLADLLSGTSPFTISTRVYVPENVNSESSGTFTGNEKHDILVSTGDNSVAYRIYKMKGRPSAHIDAYVCQGTQWTQYTSADLPSDFYNDWHDIAMVRTETGIRVLVDGKIMKTSDNTDEEPFAGSINKSTDGVHIGIEPQITSRTNEFQFSNVKIFNKALGEEEMTQILAGVNPETAAGKDSVALWLDFNTDKSAKAALETAIEAAGEYQAEDYTPQSFQALTDALDAAAETADNKYAFVSVMNARKAAIEAAIEALKEKEPEVQLDTSLLEAAIEKASQISQAGRPVQDPAVLEHLANQFEAASAVLASPESQQAINEAAADLNDALLALRLKPSKDALNSL